jgi:hypothetical protein
MGLELLVVPADPSATGVPPAPPDDSALALVDEDSDP